MEALVRLGGEDPLITMWEFLEATGITRYALDRRCGGWAGLRERAGLPVRGRVGSQPIFSEGEVREAFRRVLAEVGPNVTLWQFCERSGISQTVVHRRFGTWTRLRALEGLAPNRRGARGTPVEEVREAFRRVYAEVGKSLTIEQFEERTGYSARVIRNAFGSWTKLRDLEGAEENKPARPLISDEALMAEYERVVRCTKGKMPSFEVLGMLSAYGSEGIASGSG